MTVTTLSGFSGPPTASQTFGTLRLSGPAAEYSRTRRPRTRSRSRAPRRISESDTSTLRPEEGRCVVQLTGYDQHAATAIRAASTAGEDVLALPWTGCDTVMSLMKRIEGMLCIPLMYWRLACDGEVLDPAISTLTHPQFLKGSSVDLVLVPLGALDQFADDQQATTSSSSVPAFQEPGQASSNIAQALAGSGKGALDVWSPLRLSELPDRGS